MPHRRNIIEDLPKIPAATTHCSAWHLRRGLAIYSQDHTDVSPVLARQEERPEEPLRDPLLVCASPIATCRTQSHSTFFWAHNTSMQAAISILRDEELIRPSKWQEQPLPNRDYANCVVACDGLLLAAVKAAAQFAGVHTDRPMCIGGSARLRQHHCTIPRGGVYADIAASHYYDCVHAKDGRWKLRSLIAVPSYVGMFW